MADYCDWRCHSTRQTAFHTQLRHDLKIDFRRATGEWGVSAVATVALLCAIDSIRTVPGHAIVILLHREIAFVYLFQ